MKERTEDMSELEVKIVRLEQKVEHLSDSLQKDSNTRDNISCSYDKKFDKILETLEELGEKFHELDAKISRKCHSLELTQKEHENKIIEIEKQGSKTWSLWVGFLMLFVSTVISWLNQGIFKINLK